MFVLPLTYSIMLGCPWVSCLMLYFIFLYEFLHLIVHKYYSTVNSYYLYVSIVLSAHHMRELSKGLKDLIFYFNTYIEVV